jgi:hypothetical protein
MTGHKSFKCQGYIFERNWSKESKGKAMIEHSRIKTEMDHFFKTSSIDD